MSSAFHKSSIHLPFITDILSQRSVSIVGLEKNTGKTETLNYILNRLQAEDMPMAITSIGVDGEQIDSVTQTSKPEITLPKNMVFVTSEQHYFQKKVFADILDVSERHTALGRLVTARALMSGKVLLSGPADTAGIKEVINRMKSFGVKTTLVDGALSRLSLASPTVTDAMILATGAVVSANLKELVRKTLYVKQLIDLKCVEPELADKLIPLEKGLWAIDDDGVIHDLEIPSVFLLDKNDKDVMRFGSKLYVSGAVSDKLLQFLKSQKQQVELIIRDFSKMFASKLAYDAFIKSGHSVKTVTKNKLIAVTVNPVSPSGVRLDSIRLQEAMREALQVPVYDVKTIKC